jgi:hypothetical protein
LGAAVREVDDDGAVIGAVKAVLFVRRQLSMLLGR